MKLTQRHKKLIRSWWSQYKLRFTADGQVLARRVNNPNGSYGLLYTRRELENHVQYIEDQKAAGYDELKEITMEGRIV